MKNILTIFILFLAVNSFGAVPGFNNHDGSLVYGLNFNEATGTTAYNIIPTTSNCVITGNWANIGKGSCLQLDNTVSPYNAAQGVINHYQNLDFSNELTVMCWAKVVPHVEKLETCSYCWALIGNWTDVGGSFKSWFLAAASSPMGVPGRKFAFQWTAVTSGSPSDNIFGTVNIAYDCWIHIAVTFNRGLVKMYQNGQLVTQKQSAITPLCSFYKPTYIGKLYPGTGWDSDFNGYIDDMYLFNRALKGGEIWAIYNGGKGKHR